MPTAIYLIMYKTWFQWLPLYWTYRKDEAEKIIINSKKYKIVTIYEYTTCSKTEE